MFEVFKDFRGLLYLAGLYDWISVPSSFLVFISKFSRPNFEIANSVYLRTVVRID